MKICFTGDLFLGGDLKYSNSTQIVLSEHFHNADLRIANLEQAISNNPERAEKSTLYSNEGVLETAKLLNVDAVALSNNHIHDKKDQGITDTLNSLDKYGISFFGAGKNLEQAEQPYFINDKLCIIGYCEYDKAHLSKVKVAGKNSPGVNPLNYEKIKNDLAALPDKVKAILHFHWGREHVCLPDHEHIELAKKILTHDKVLLIIGMHSHRAQGIVKKNGKIAYLSLGNFLFPNFFLEPRTHISYPPNDKTDVKTTKDYHFVGKLTYKKWRTANRVSLMAVLDTQDQSIRHIPVYQHRERPVVQELSGIKKKLVLGFVQFCTLSYRLPSWLYKPIQKIYRLLKKALRYGYIFYFLLRQNGFNWTVHKTLDYLKR